MRHQVICAGPVYEWTRQKIGKNKWKDSWLSLDENGTLIWSKNRDDEHPLAIADVQKIYRQIKFDVSQNDGQSAKDLILTSHVMTIPMEMIKSGEKCTKRFSVKNAKHLQGWMESFAKSLSKLELLRKIQEAYGTESHFSSSSSMDIHKKDIQFVVYSPDSTPTFWRQFLESIA